MLGDLVVNSNYMYIIYVSMKIQGTRWCANGNNYDCDIISLNWEMKVGK